MSEQEVIESTALTLPNEVQFKGELLAINRFQQVVHANMVQGHDYGVIPGTQKPTLLKPGAEKIAKLLGLADLYDIINSKEDWDKPFFRYIVKCKLARVRDGVTVSEGLGECNSMEAKYRWRDAKRKCPECGAEAIIKGKAEYGGGWLCFAKKGGCGEKFQDGSPEIEEQKLGQVENEDIYSQVNTILKMAKKRSLVDAALSAGRLSDIFTQDIEEIMPMPTEPKTEPFHQTVKPPEPAKESQGMTSTRPGKVIEPTPENKIITAINIEAGKQGIDQNTLCKELDIFAANQKWLGLNAIREDHFKALIPAQLALFFDHVKGLRTK